MELLRPTANTFGDGCFDSGDGAVAVVERVGISDRGINEDFAVAVAFLSGTLAQFWTLQSRRDAGRLLPRGAGLHALRRRFFTR